MPESVESVRSAQIAWPVRATGPPHRAAPIDHRAMFHRLFLLGLVLVAVVKGVEAKVFGDLAIDFDPWAFGGLFVGQMLFDASAAGRRSALIIGLGVTALLLREHNDRLLGVPGASAAAMVATVGAAMLAARRLSRGGEFLRP
jgi:hypothetical protein